MDSFVLSADEAATLQAALVERGITNCPICGLTSWALDGWREKGGRPSLIARTCKACGFDHRLAWTEKGTLIPFAPTNPAWQHLTDDQVLAQVEKALADDRFSTSYFLYALIYSFGPCGGEGPDADALEEQYQNAAEAEADPIADQGTPAVLARIRRLLTEENVRGYGRTERVITVMQILDDEYSLISGDADHDIAPPST